jgi:uncharacterized protein involved in outer membrane biogenesis
MRLRKSLSVIGLVLAVLITGGITYLFTADLGRHRELIESIVSNSLGRKFSIEGDFHFRLGRVIRLSAGQIRVANAPWAKTPDMLDANQLALQLNLWSLISKPITIHSLSIGTARIDLERNKQNQANWDLGRQKTAPTLPLFVEHADAHQIAVTFRDPDFQHPVDVRLGDIQIAEDQKSQLYLTMNTHIGAYNGTLAGKLGPLPSLLTGQHLTFSLKGDSKLGNFSMNGAFASLKNLEQPEIKLTASGPKVETITSLFNIPAIAKGPFKVTGTVTGRSGNVNLNLSADAGNLNAEVQLAASNLKRSPALNLVTQLRGPNLGETASLLGVKNLPQQSFTLEGHVLHDRSGTLLEKIQLQAKSIHVLADGRLGKAPGYQDTSLTLKAQGPDLSVFAPALGLKQMRAAKFNLTGHIEQTKKGLMLESGQLDVAENKLQATGVLGTLPNLDGADLNFSLSAPDLASLGTVTGVGKLPHLPINGDGHIRQSDGTLVLDSLDLDLGVATVSSHGTLALKSLARKSLSRNSKALKKSEDEGTELNVTIAGKDLSRVGKKFGVKQFPAQPFKATFRASYSGDTMALQDVNATVGSARLSGNASMNQPHFLRNARLEFLAQGSDLGMLLQNIKKAPAPHVQFKLQASLATNGDRTSVKKLTASIGATRMSAQGTLGEPPKLINTKLDVKLSGKSLASALKPFGITEHVPDESFEFSGHVAGGLKRITLASVQTRVGENHGHGDITLVPGKPARLTLRLNADTLDLTPLLAKAGKPAAKPKPASPDNKLVIPNTPLDIKWPEDMQASADINIGHFRFKKLQVDNFNVEGKLASGKLDIQPVKGLIHGGKINGSLLLQKQDNGVQAKLNLKATNTRLALQKPPDIPINKLPPSDIDISLSGHGRSLHDLAASANGHIQLVYGEGDIENKTGVGLLTTSLLLEIFRTLIPFTKEEPVTQLQCGLVVADAKDGVLTTDAMLLQTKRLLITSSGHLNLHDESLDFVFGTKPREGLGISIAGILNPYMKVAGTLSHWNLTLNPEGAAISGGAAAATGGLSVLAGALWNRIKNFGDPCGRELKKRDLPLPGSK